MNEKSLSTIQTKELLFAYTNNALTGNGKLLVLFLFNNSKEIRLARTHPKSWQADTTYRTNNEKKNYLQLHHWMVTIKVSIRVVYIFQMHKIGYFHFFLMNACLFS